MERTILLRNVVIGGMLVLLIAALTWRWTSREREDAGAAPPIDPSPATVEPEPPEGDPAERGWSRRLGVDPEWPDPLDAPGDCDAIERDLASVCDALDAGPYALEGRSSCGLLQDAVTALAASPPRASAELRRHADVLRNVHHAFRVLGRGSLDDLRSLARDRELVEAGALALYRWVGSRPDCDPEGPSVAPTVLYDYASFAFTTLGGQAYLRRRTPAVEAVACYWALHVLDRSIARGHNPNGVDPRREIDRCRALVATQPLVFGERYEEGLRRMAERWEEHTP